MQLPSENVPVSKCLRLAAYSARMLGKFPQNQTLTQLSQRMSAGAASLAEAENTLIRTQDGILVIRVDASFEDYASDHQIRRTFKMAEIADGRKGGRISSQVFPKGLTAIVRRQGDKQVQYMQDLESRIQAAVDIWPEAEAERTDVAEHRARYHAALQARDEKEREIRAVRAARDANKSRFLELYAEISNRVKAEFPRDRVKADLFFDRVRARQGAASGAPDEGAEGAEVVDDVEDIDAPTEQALA